MGVRLPDGFPETDASADAQDIFRKKYLDIPALTRVFARQILSGSFPCPRYVVQAEPHHHRALTFDGWSDVHPGDPFDITASVLLEAGYVRVP